MAKNKQKRIEQIKGFLKLGFSNSRAAQLAGVPASTVSIWLSKSDKLRNEFDSLRDSVTAEARRIVMNSIVKRRDKEDAKWWIDKFDKDVERGDGPSVNILQQINISQDELKRIIKTG